jgi:hypothetical protein
MGERRRSVAEVAGETLREIAVLVAVFFMLDNLMEDAGYPLTVTLSVLAACILTLLIGIVLECYSPDDH